MQKDDWTYPPTPLSLRDHQVDVWRVTLDRYPDSTQWAESTLSTDEAERAARFHFEDDRHRFTLSRACLRDILARYLHCHPGQIKFAVNAYGKPVLLPADSWDFNLSHSGNFALIAVARRRKVGVDVERLRMNMGHDRIARRFFSQAEYEEFSATPHEQKMTAFFNGWTRKEAYVKARGLGLSLPLDSFDVSLAPNDHSLLRATRPNPGEASKWTLLSLDVHPGYAGALAAGGTNLDFRMWDWELHSDIHHSVTDTPVRH
jgi:4'-phosphopantetheinyl transferase